MYGLPVFSVVVSTVKCGCESLLGYGLVALGWRGSVLFFLQQWGGGLCAGCVFFCVGNLGL